MNFTAFDHACMAEALRLAEKGRNTCRPNPRVGCVLARQGEIVGRGWHERAGQGHAEVMALADAADRAKGSTAYVTLEPCSHQGRTGPCTEALAQAGVEAVIAATEDPNPQVNGQGLEQLRSAGLAVSCGLMSEQATALNAGFFSRIRLQRPWVRIKLAHSLDGRTALRNGASQWISSAASRADVQRWRARSCAVLTGIGTLRADNPSLNVRLEGVPQPARVIVDSHWLTTAGARTLQLPGKVIIAGREDVEMPRELAETSAELWRLPPAAGRGIDLAVLMRKLAGMELNEVQVEAGPTLCGALLSAGLVDEILLYVAPSMMGTEARGMFDLGVLEHMTERAVFEWIEADRVGPDLRLRLRPIYGEETCSQAS